MCLSVIIEDHKRFSSLLLELIVEQSQLGIKPFDCKCHGGGAAGTPPQHHFSPVLIMIIVGKSSIIY
jgi:hypothetical protein